MDGSYVEVRMTLEEFAAYVTKRDNLVDAAYDGSIAISKLEKLRRACIDSSEHYGNGYGCLFVQDISRIVGEPIEMWTGRAAE